MSQYTVLTLQIDVLECGDDVGSDFKMPKSLNMTAYRYGGGSITVWAGISRGGRIYLHIVIRGMMTGVRYRDDHGRLRQTVL